MSCQICWYEYVLIHRLCRSIEVVRIALMTHTFQKNDLQSKKFCSIVTEFYEHVFSISSITIVMTYELNISRLRKIISFSYF